jgi:hypothetical protein
MTYDLELDLGGARFDPLRRLPPLPEAFAMGDVPLAPDGLEAVVIQLHGVPVPEETKELKRRGLEMQVYISDAGYLERLPPTTVRALEHHPLVRAIVPFEPTFKLLPELLRRATDPELREAAPERPFVVVGFDGISAKDLRASVEALGLVVNNAVDQAMKPHGTARLIVVLPRYGDLAALTRLATVLSVETVGEVTLNSVL